MADPKQQQQEEQTKPAQKLMKNVWLGVAPDYQMKRVGVARECSLQHRYSFPIHSVQQHLKSKEHTNNKKNYHNLTLLNNPTLKAESDMFLKGENPFGNPQGNQLQL
ncbi:hypothetical protein scyTo_0010239 [Scyliorhinus torazame]|uniref:Uncharacterized protein n=1 Tax=Scyliorhinus torazame TaxID=75743 RepID=A0A401P2M3_SCYTO|nr:hypothetical protein [Scyliorhinus torazame]